jgi:hypothetical protein
MNEDRSEARERLFALIFYSPYVLYFVAYNSVVFILHIWYLVDILWCVWYKYKAGGYKVMFLKIVRAL